MNQLNGIAIVILVALAYLLIWCGVMIVLARFSGWIALADRYEFRGEFIGKRWRFQHAQFRWSMNYSGCVTVGANAEGLFLSIMPPFNIGHSKLFIPWGETVIQMKKSFWMGCYMEIQFPQVPGTVIRFGRRLATRIAETIGPQLSS